MAPARLLSQEPEDVTDYVTHKRRRLEIRHKESPRDHHDKTVTQDLDDELQSAHAHEEAEEDDETETAIVSHPYNIRPSGNAYTASRDIKTFTGSFTALPDELILQLLEHLNAVDLARLGGTCKALYAFCRAEDLWKTLFIEHPPCTPFSWLGSWRSTHLVLPANLQTAIQCTDLYSDALYLPFHRAHVPLSSYAQNIPARNSIARLSNLTADDFNTNWATKPFILTEPVRGWPLFKQWSWDYLHDKYHNVSFRAEAVDWPYSTYETYMRNNTDESPLYLFDCRFAEKMNLTIGDSAIISTSDTLPPSYTPPSCFHPDLFTTLGPHRPDHRWLIIGPARSGSTFHADPNGTSAWNAVIRGSKYWILFPPTTDEMPGLHISADASEITAPLSIAEYLLNFHAAARRHPGCIEAICAEGEILHVPSGWYHMVLNLEDGIALTQNFVPKAHLANVLEFLRDKKDQVSGFGRDDVDDKCKGVEEGGEYDLFVGRLREEGFTDDLEIALEEMAKRDEKKGRKSKWEVLTGKCTGDADNGAVESSAGGFSFGFGFAEDDDDDDDEEEEEEEAA